MTSNTGISGSINAGIDSIIKSIHGNASPQCVSSCFDTFLNQPTGQIPHSKLGFAGTGITN